MFYRLRVTNISDRILHIVGQEASKRGHIVRLCFHGERDSMLSIRCSEEAFLPDLVSTLKTDPSLDILSFTKSTGEAVDLSASKRKVFPHFTRHTLSLDDENFSGVTYA